MYPSKKDIDEAIDSLGIHLDAHSFYSSMMHSKRLGGMLEMAKTDKNISDDEYKSYHLKINNMIQEQERRSP